MYLLGKSQLPCYLGISVLHSCMLASSYSPAGMELLSTAGGPGSLAGWLSSEGASSTLRSSAFLGPGRGPPGLSRPPLT